MGEIITQGYIVLAMKMIQLKDKNYFPQMTTLKDHFEFENLG